MFEKLNVTPSFNNSITVALQKGMLSHALIIEGGNSDIRLSAAKEIAKAVLCQGEIKPCGICAKCRKIESDSHPDLHILKKDEKSTMIKVDAVRELKKKALVFPNDGDKSVFIIDGAEFMNPQAQNALLKIFEEPARHLLFILCCGAKSSLLDTIISRATSYSLGKDSQSVSADEKQTKALQTASELLGCFIDENEVEFLKKIASFTKDKELLRNTLIAMKTILRDAIILQNGGKDLLSGYGDTAKKLATRLTVKKAMELLKAVELLHGQSLMNSNYNLTLTRLSALFFKIKSH